MTKSHETIEFHATSGVFIQSDHLINPDDLERVFNLYLPFIGATSYALYHLLVNELPFANSHLHRQDHNFLIDSLNVSLPNFVKFRRRLEAAGLIKTYHENDAVGEVYGYRLLTPLSAEKFFKEPLLASLLYKFVGEERYLELQKRYDKQGQDVLVGNDISARFLHVFQNQNDMNIPKTPIVYQEAQVQIDPVNFKFDDFADMIHGASRDEVEKHHNFLVAMHLNYGVDEVTLANVVSQSVTLDKHEINERDIQRQLRSISNNMRLSKTATEKILRPNDEQVPEIKNSEARALIELARHTNAQDFLMYVKTTLKNGLVLKNERDLVDYLLAQSALSMAVINILVHYVLIGLQNDSLKAALVTTIADSWTQNHVDSPEKALIQIQQHQQASQTRQEKRFSRSKKMEKTTPKFLKQAEATLESGSLDSVPSDEAAAALAKLKNIKTKN
ncbi:DnaD domain protein [Leuconostoc palmae]|uniref:DnaD domain protein n=1 Tax=Leuconostoc palmae TaxID=501487 RepID=UPI001C7E0D46|nr:DnaD domain protein [Leuconostoc palmae]